MADKSHTTNPSVVAWIEYAIASGIDPMVTWNIDTDEKSVNMRAVPALDEREKPDDWGEIIDELVRMGRVIRHETPPEGKISIPNR